MMMMKDSDDCGSENIVKAHGQRGGNIQWFPAVGIRYKCDEFHAPDVLAPTNVNLVPVCRS
jgi:hypothetical protein